MEHAEPRVKGNPRRNMGGSYDEYERHCSQLRRTRKEIGRAGEEGRRPLQSPRQDSKGRSMIPVRSNPDFFVTALSIPAFCVDVALSCYYFKTVRFLFSLFCGHVNLSDFPMNFVKEDIPQMLIPWGLHFGILKSWRIKKSRLRSECKATGRLFAR